MKRVKDHTKLEGVDVLEALLQAGERGATAKQITSVLTVGGPVDTKSPRYEYVRVLLQDVTNAGLVDKERDGRSYTYTIHPDGIEYLDGVETDDEPATDNELDEILAEAEGDGMDLDVPPEPEPTPRKEDTGEVTREKVERPKYHQEWVDNAPEDTKTVWNHYKDGREICPHSGQIISRDPVADGLVDENGEPTHPNADAIRTECECGSIRKVKKPITANGELKMHNHEIAHRDVSAMMKHPFIRHTEEGLRWVTPEEIQAEDENPVVEA